MKYLFRTTDRRVVGEKCGTGNRNNRRATACGENPGYMLVRRFALLGILLDQLAGDPTIQLAIAQDHENGLNHFYL